MNVALAHLDNFLLWFPLFSIVIAKIFCLLYDVNQCRRKKPQWKLAGNIETIFFRSNRLWNREHIENNLNCHGSGTNTHSHTPNRVYLNMEIKKSKKSYYLYRFLNGSILAHMIFCSSSLATVQYTFRTHFSQFVWIFNGRFSPITESMSLQMKCNPFSRAKRKNSTRNWFLLFVCLARSVLCHWLVPQCHDLFIIRACASLAHNFPHELLLAFAIYVPRIVFHWIISFWLKNRPILCK